MLTPDNELDWFCDEETWHRCGNDPEMASSIARQLREAREAIRSILNASHLDCDSLHHTPSEYHSAMDPCPVANRLVGRARACLPERSNEDS